MVSTILQWVQLALTMGMSALLIVFFWRVAVQLARPDWSAKQRRLNGLDLLPQAKLAELFRRARAPLNSVFRLLAVLLITVMAVIMANLALYLALAYSPFAQLAFQPPYRGWFDFIFGIMLPCMPVALLLFGFWLVIKARSIEASQEIDRLDRQANNIPEPPDDPELIKAVKPGASVEHLRWFGAALLLMAVYIAYKYSPPDLPALQQAVAGIIGEMRNRP